MSADLPRQTQARRGYSIFYKGKTLLSNIDPVGQAERLADSVPMQERTLYVCLSPIYGYGLERLMERMATHAPNSAILCIEADEHLYRISEENFNDEITDSGKLRLTNAREKAALCVFLRQNWGQRRFRRIHRVCLNGGWQLFPELYDSLIEALQREIATDWSNALVMTKLGRLYIRNALRNLELLSRYPSLTQLSFGDAPVLTLGAGPSLDALLDGLERHFGGKLEKSVRPFRIVCVDTGLKALRARNIEPDLAVILESQHWNLGDFIGLGDWVIPAAMDLSALPASGKLPGLQPWLFFTKWTELRFFDRLGKTGLLPLVFPPLGSVGLSATAIALRLTSGPVLTGGMDFSYSIDSSHARSTPTHMAKLRRQNRFTGLLNAAALAAAAFEGAQKFTAKNSRQVLSNPALRNYRDIFEQEFSGNTRLFDTRSSGLPLGIQTLTEQEFHSLLEHTANKKRQAAAPGQENTQTVNTAGKKQLADFLRAEHGRLLDLKNILAGKTPEEQGQPAEESFPLQKLEILIDECDYLWAHFPDYAETGGKRPVLQELAAATPQALSFLKRLRAEIDAALKIYEALLL